MNRLIGDMEELVRRTVGPSVELEVVGLAGLRPALIDPGQLENALLNLCINARDAMPDGGRITADVGLPGGMNGRQTADAGRERRPELKALFITGYAETAVLGNGCLRPDMQVLTKPFVLETLAARIKDLIADA